MLRVLKKLLNPTVIKKEEGVGGFAGVLTAVLPSPLETPLLNSAAPVTYCWESHKNRLHTHTNTHTLLSYLTCLLSPAMALLFLSLTSSLNTMQHLLS